MLPLPPAVWSKSILGDCPRRTICAPAPESLIANVAALVLYALVSSDVPCLFILITEPPPLAPTVVVVTPRILTLSRLV